MLRSTPSRAEARNVCKSKRKTAGTLFYFIFPLASPRAGAKEGAPRAGERKTASSFLDANSLWCITATWSVEHQ